MAGSSIMQFVRESGAVIDQDDNPITIIRGEPGYVDFPEELIWDMHKTHPGFIYKLAHIHPDGMGSLSERDKKTMKTWSHALYPFPIILSVITRFSHDSDYFYETEFIGMLEAREIWKKNGGKRKFSILEYKKRNLWSKPSPWDDLLINISFE